MSRQLELERLDRVIRDGAIRIFTVQNNIEILDREISTLHSLEATLRENVETLKSKNIVPKASAFKQAKEELAKAKNRLIVLKNEREDYRKALDRVNQAIQESKEAIDKIKRDGDNNVLHAVFGKKDNG